MWGGLWEDYKLCKCHVQICSAGPCEPNQLLFAIFARRKRSPQKAEMYLQGALKNYMAEGWALPVTHTRKQLAECQKHLGQMEKYPLVPALS